MIIELGINANHIRAKSNDMTITKSESKSVNLDIRIIDATKKTKKPVI
jgi:hypothetical protein